MGDQPIDVTDSDPMSRLVVALCHLTTDVPEHRHGVAQAVVQVFFALHNLAGGGAGEDEMPVGAEFQTARWGRGHRVTFLIDADGRRAFRYNAYRPEPQAD